MTLTKWVLGHTSRAMGLCRLSPGPRRAGVKSPVHQGVRGLVGLGPRLKPLSASLEPSEILSALVSVPGASGLSCPVNTFTAGRLPHFLW